MYHPEPCPHCGEDTNTRTVTLERRSGPALLDKLDAFIESVTIARRAQALAAIEEGKSLRDVALFASSILEEDEQQNKVTRGLVDTLLIVAESKLLTDD